MPYDELDESNMLARNMTGMRRGGKGGVAFGGATLEEVPYIIGLIRQSLERQLDDATGSS